MSYLFYIMLFLLNYVDINFQELCILIKSSYQKQIAFYKINLFFVCYQLFLIITIVSGFHAIIIFGNHFFQAVLRLQDLKYDVVFRSNAEYISPSGLFQFIKHCYIVENRDEKTSAESTLSLYGFKSCLLMTLIPVSQPFF